ncbi:unnamed protein product [Diamesa tonsa]
MLRQLFGNLIRKTGSLKFLSSVQTPAAVSEQNLVAVLKKTFPEGVIKVQDVSGGCGAMFEIHIKAKDFLNLSMVKQHQMVNQALKQEIKEMHGVRIYTEAG